MSTSNTQSNMPNSSPGQGKGMIWCLQALTIVILVGVAFSNSLESIVKKWMLDGNWSHGWLVPLFSIYFLYEKREKLAKCQVQTFYPAFVMLLACIAGYLYFIFINPFGYPRNIMMLLALFFACWFNFGKEVMRYAWFPILFIGLAIPLPDNIFAQLTLPLRHLASAVSAGIMKLSITDLDIGTSGVVIDYIYNGQSGSLNVEEACSGMRLMMAFVTLGLAMAYLGDRPLWQRLIMAACCIPIAVFCNIIRVTVTGFINVLGEGDTKDFAEGDPHAMLGLAMLPIALGLYYLIGYILSNLFVEQDDEDIENQNNNSTVASGSE